MKYREVYVLMLREDSLVWWKQDSLTFGPSHPGTGLLSLSPGRTEGSQEALNNYSGKHLGF